MTDAQIKAQNLAHAKLMRRLYSKEPAMQKVRTDYVDSLNKAGK